MQWDASLLKSYDADIEHLHPFSWGIYIDY